MSPKLDSVVDIDSNVIDVSTFILNILITNLTIQNYMRFSLVFSHNDMIKYPDFKY